MTLHILSRRRRVTGRHIAPVVEWAITCPVCGFDLGGYDDEHEAAYLVGIHNDLHHGSHPVALVAPVTEPASGSSGWSGDAA